MKHCCHCGFREHFSHFKTKKLGLLGGVLLILHLLWHVAECLILPALFVGTVNVAAKPQEHMTEDRPVLALPLLRSEVQFPLSISHLRDYQLGTNNYLAHDYDL